MTRFCLRAIALDTEVTSELEESESVKDGARWRLELLWLESEGAAEDDATPTAPW